MENQPKLNSSKEVIAFLAERFPLCFAAEGEARPLKIGIFQDLVERVQGEMNLSKTQLRSALRLYTSSWRYLYGVKAGAQRVDLDGNACGELEEQHVEHARKQLKEAKARVQARREKQKSEQEAEAKTEKSDKAVSARPSRPAAKSREEKNVSAERAKSIRTKKPRSGSETQPPKPEAVTDPSLLKPGQSIKVKAGKSAMDATILEVTKDGIRVQLTTGLAMIVRTEHLQF